MYFPQPKGQKESCNGAIPLITLETINSESLGRKFTMGLVSRWIPSESRLLQSTSWK